MKEELVRMVFPWLLFLAATAAGLEVTIEEYFGDVTLLQGKEQRLTCTVEDPDPVGAIRWRIGDRLLDPRECSNPTAGSCMGAPLQEVEEGVLQQSLTFVPTIQDDGKDLVCEFFVSGEKPSGSAVDKITLLVYQRDLKILQPEAVGLGESSMIKVEAKLYPVPKEKDFLWRVEHFDGKLVAELMPGETDPQLPGYRTSEIHDKGNRNYLLTFTIVSMSREEAENRYSLTVGSPDPAKILKFNVPFLVSETESSATDWNHSSSQGPTSFSDEGEVTTSNIGLFIIIGLLIFCLILCIIFCAVRRRKKVPDSKRAASDGKGAFAPVSSKDTHPPPVGV